MQVRVLGCSGAIAKDCRTTSFLIGDNILIDAGTGVGDLTLDEMRQIDHVFLTHSHLDHIAALPLMLDAVSSLRSLFGNWPSAPSRLRRAGLCLRQLDRDVGSDDPVWVISAVGVQVG